MPLLVRHLFLFFLLLLPVAGQAQPPESWLEKGRLAYRNDQLDSALIYYQQAYLAPAADTKLEALTGQLKVTIQQVRMEAAEALVSQADQLLRETTIDAAVRCRYKTAKAEFFRKNSQLEQALRLHQEVARESAGLTDEPKIHAYALYYTALTFENLSVFDSSLLYVDRAYALFQQALDTTSVEFIGIYNGLGVCYYRANQIEKAKDFYLKSKALAEAKLGPVSSDLAIALGNLSSISRAEEDYPQAIRYSEQGLKISRALGNEAGEASAYYALGVYHYFLGDYGRTKDYMEACIAIRQRLFSPLHYSLIGPYEVLGIAHEEAGNYDRTLEFLRKGRQLILANYEAGSIIEGYNYENTAICFTQTGSLDSALLYIQKANTILPQQLPANDYSLAVHYFTFANVLYEMGKLEEAQQQLRVSNQIYQVLGMQQSSEYALNLAQQGTILGEQYHWQQGDAAFEAGLEVLQTPALDDADGPAFQLSPNTLEFLNAYTKYLYRKYQATRQGAALEEFERYSELYLELSDKFRRQFIDPYTKSILIKDNAEVYDRNIGIYNALYRETQQEQYLRAAYRFSEYGRTCLLRDLQDDKIQHYAGVPDSLLVQEQQLKKQIAELHQQFLDNPEDQSLKQTLFDQKKALSDHIAYTLQAHPRYHDLKFGSNVPDLDTIQAQLQPDHHLIEYMQDDTAYYALVLSQKSQALTHLGNKQTIDSTIRLWKQAIQHQDFSNYQSIGQNLYRFLWEPLVDHLQNRRVTIIPVGPLFYLNFETLPAVRSTKSFLIEEYLISYALSISVLAVPQEAAAHGPILAIAPGFESALKQQYQEKLDSLEAPDEAFLHTVRQPWSLQFAKTLERRFAGQSYTGLQATEAAIKADLQKGQILYFGTHAIADPEDPLRSKLVLAKNIGAQIEDGYLHAYELFGLPLKAELAILSACESGLGQVQKGEGMISLAYSIHFAGCPSTVMSLWKVDEKVNTQLTEAFIHYLDRGLSKSAALRQAKLDYLESAPELLRHPFYWGGMVLMGQDGTLQLPRKAFWQHSWFPFGLIGGLALLALFFRRRTQRVQQD